MKTNQSALSYKTLGAQESKLLTTLLKLNKSVFSAAEAKSVLQLSTNSTKQILFSLRKKGWIKKVARGFYELSVEGIEGSEDAVSIASQLVWPSYLSLWSALNFYGFTEQVPQTLFFVTTSRGRKIKISGVECRFYHISNNRFFGYEKSGRISIAEKEKAVIDSLYFLSEIPFDEIEKAFEQGKSLDKERLIDYALKMKSKSLIKRLGFLMEKNKLFPLGAKKNLLKKIGRGYSLLDPASVKNEKYNKEWKLIINR